MSESFKALETRYKGYRFRSRTEARWAVFFDAIGIKWDYEKDGYDLGEGGGLYLPDFWLPESQLYAEVKGQEFTVKEVNLCRILALKSTYPVVMLPGSPEAQDYFAELPNGLLGAHEWRVDSSILEQAVDRARTARFEHGEMPAQEKITSARVYRGEYRGGGERNPARIERGASAERELIRAILFNPGRIAQIAEKLHPESFREPNYRAIYTALLTSSEPEGEAKAMMEEILSEGSIHLDAERTIGDSQATLRARDLDARAAEIDRLIPLASEEAKDRLIEEKHEIRKELTATGRKYFKRFKP